MPKPFEVTLKLPVRTYDIDYAGVVSNQVYIRWLEDLRMEILDTYFPLSEQLAQNFSPLLMRTEIDYRRSVRLFEQPIGSMWIPKVSRLKWFVSADIQVNGSVVAHAEQMGCFVDLTSWKPISVPAPLRQPFETQEFDQE